MKTHGFREYSRILNPSYSKHFRRLSEIAGEILTGEILMLAVALIFMKLGYGGSGYWGGMLGIITVNMITGKKFSSYGILSTDSRNNLFFRTIPGRRSVLKKALFCSEINRFLCVAVFSAGAETAMVADGKPLRVYNAVFQMMILYMVVSLIVYLYRTAKRGGIAVSVIVGLGSLIVQAIVINADIKPVMVIIISFAGVIFSVFLNYMIIRKLAGTGRKTK